MAILEQLFDMLTRVGIPDLRLLSGVEPNLPFADTGDCAVREYSVNENP
jgi:hypothetical protein